MKPKSTADVWRHLTRDSGFVAHVNSYGALENEKRLKYRPLAKDGAPVGILFWPERMSEEETEGTGWWLEATKRNIAKATLNGSEITFNAHDIYGDIDTVTIKIV